MTQVPELKIKWEWEPGELVRAPEHAATWARIEIWVGADCVTLVEDIASGSSRRSIYCPLYPLAEWVAYSWWHLMADARPAREVGMRLRGAEGSHQKVLGRLQRHSIRASGDGFLWPNLLIVPEGRQSRLSWQREGMATSGRPVRFLTQGDVLVQRDSVMRELSRLVLEVLNRLAEAGIKDTPLHQEWRAINQASSEEVEYCLAAARLGLDPYAEAEPYEDVILRASGMLSGGLLDDFLDAVEPDHVEAALSWVEEARSLIYRDSGGTRGEIVRTLRRQVREDLAPWTSFPWEMGWTQAKKVRSLLEVDSYELFGLEKYVTSKRRDLDDRGLLAAGDSVDGANPVVVIGHNRMEPARRFTLARALWHYLWGEDGGLFLVTTSYTDRQKVERAFAAELLAPAEGIAQILDLSPESASTEDIEQVAEHFKVSTFVVEHQLKNQLLSA